MIIEYCEKNDPTNFYPIEFNNFNYMLLSPFYSNIMKEKYNRIILELENWIVEISRYISYFENFQLSQKDIVNIKFLKEDIDQVNDMRKHMVPPYHLINKNYKLDILTNRINALQNVVNIFDEMAKKY